MIWCILTYGVCLGWIALQTTADSDVFPLLYNFSSLAVGNISLAVRFALAIDQKGQALLTEWQYLVAAFIGSAAGGLLSDWIIRLITKRRGGYFEPEFRLWCLIPPAIAAPVGLMLWGAGLQNHLPAMVPIVGTGISYAVLCAVPATGMTYVVDCYRPLAGETMTIVTAAKNTFAFGLSFAVFPWLNKDGYTKVRLAHIHPTDHLLNVSVFCRSRASTSSLKASSFSPPFPCTSTGLACVNGPRDSVSEATRVVVSNRLYAGAPVVVLNRAKVHGHEVVPEPGCTQTLSGWAR